MAGEPTAATPARVTRATSSSDPRGRRRAGRRAGPRRASARARAILPLAMLTVVVFIWSSNNIASKLTLREMSPGLLVLVRYTVAVLLSTCRCSCCCCAPGSA
jgi:hypothetical protein